MKRESSKIDFWSLSDVVLAKNCRVIAESESAEITAAVKAEAMRLYGDWRAAIDSTDNDRHERELRAGVMAALRKRTIQILVGLSETDSE